MSWRVVFCMVFVSLFAVGCARLHDSTVAPKVHQVSLKDPPANAPVSDRHTRASDRRVSGPRPPARQVAARSDEPPPEAPPPSGPQMTAGPQMTVTPAFLKKTSPDACRPELTSKQFSRILRDYMSDVGPCDCRDHRDADGNRCGDKSAEVRASGRVHLCWGREIAIFLKEDGGIYCPGRQTLFIRPGSPLPQELAERSDP